MKLRPRVVANFSKDNLSADLFLNPGEKSVYLSVLPRT